MTVVPIDDPDDPRIADYRNVPDPALLAERGVFVAEGRLVVRALLASRRFGTRSLLVTGASLKSLEDVLEAAAPTLPIYVASKALVSGIVGFNVHRGCLALGERPAASAAEDVLPPDDADALLVVLEGIGNADNIGGIFRNAAAFGADAVLLSPGCCDPLYRKAIRVSIGGTLAVPFASGGAWPGCLARLRERGVAVVALTPGPASADIDGANAPWRARRRLALLAGTEGSGLTAGALELADYRVRIPMAPGADSLNVATAVGIALHRLSTRVTRASD
jgi:tRNA G18 (ribose-2'-O)-methylase SpoU